MIFEARVLNIKSEIEEFTISGNSEGEVRELLSKKGLKVLEIVAKKSKPLSAVLRVVSKDKISTNDLLNFTRFLSTMLKAGVPLDRSLELLTKRAGGDKIKEMITALRVGINKGQPLSKSMEPYEGYVGTIYIEMLRVGEVAGKVDETLAFLVDYLERNRELKNKIIGALIYPIVLVALGLVVAGIFIFYITPKFVDLFSGSDIKLPPTLALFTFINKSLSTYPILTLFGIVLTVGLIVWKKDKVKTVIANIGRKIYGIKTVMQNIQMARLSLVLSSLFKAGVPTLLSLDITQSSMKGTVYEEDLKKVQKGVTKGKKISEVMASTAKNIPELFIQIVEAGEESATLDESFAFLAKFYDQETDRELKNILTLLEPILLLVVGLGVGILVISIMLPLYQTITAQ